MNCTYSFRNGSSALNAGADDDRFDLFTVRAQLRQQLGLDDTAARHAGHWSKP